MTRKAEGDLYDSMDGEEEEPTEAESNMEVLVDECQQYQGATADDEGLCDEAKGEYDA